jgi:hypothetical protein
VKTEFIARELKAIETQNFSAPVGTCKKTARSDELSTADRRSNAEISSSFKPKLIWLARVNARRIKLMLSIGGERKSEWLI